MIIMPIISRFIAKWFKLDIGSGRALIFSGSTRNSLVVLPLALALPDNLSTLVAAIIVTQTIVELAGELIYIRLVPNILLRKETT
jgi:arsenite transporter